MATKYITEVLKEINNNTDLMFSGGEYQKRGNGGPLGTMFNHAFTKEGKFILPEGEPPFKPSPEPIGMTPSVFINEIKKFHYFMNTTLKANKREMLFVQMCESIHPDEAKILVAVKDQKLHELYPNITPEIVQKAGFLTGTLIEVQPIKPAKKSSSKPKNVETPGE